MEGLDLALELGLGGIYFLLLTLIVFIYTFNKKGIEYKFLRIGFVLKLLGGFAFGLVYLLYYGYGDTFTYFESARILSDIISDDPVYGTKLVFGYADYIRAEDLLYNHRIVNYYRGDDTFNVIKIAAFLSIIGLKSFFCTTLLFSVFAFFGQWKLYQTFAKRYPNLKKELAIAHFLIPSVIFWGSGILKDSLIIGFLGILIFQLSRLHDFRNIKLKSILIIAICVFFIYTIKGYVLLALFPAVLFWIFFSVNSKLESKILKTIIFPMLLLVVTFSSIYSYTVISSIDDKYAQENLIDQAVTYQSNHFTEIEQEGTRSGYTLGEYDRSISGMLRNFIPAIVVTLFRPFPWEIKNIVMALASFESVIFSFFALLTLYRFKLKTLFRLLTNDSFLIMVISFTLIFAFIVGFSAYNFGALVRYKIPCLPMFSSILVIFMYSNKSKLKIRK